MGKIHIEYSAQFEGRDPEGVDITTMAESPRSEGLRMSRVAFPTDTRTRWHSHAGGQLLYLVSGLGDVRIKGGETASLAPGEAYWTEGGTCHQHGAAGSAEAVFTVATVGGTDWHGCD